MIKALAKILLALSCLTLPAFSQGLPAIFNGPPATLNCPGPAIGLDIVTPNLYICGRNAIGIFQWTQASPNITGAITPIINTSSQSGLTSDVRISRAVAALTAGNGIVWANDVTPQTWAACPTWGAGNVQVVLFTNTYTVNANCTIPANVQVYFNQGAILAPAAGVTITINGSVAAGERQQIVNTANGTVVFLGNNPIFAGWYGAIQNLAVDDALGTQIALDNNPGKTIKLAATASSLCTGGTQGSGCTGAPSAQFLTPIIMRQNGAGLVMDTNETWPDGGAWINVPNVLNAPAIWVNQNCYGCKMEHIHVRGPNIWNPGQLTTFAAPASTSMSGLDNDGITISGGLFHGEDIGAEGFLRHGILICGDATCDAGQPDYWQINRTYNVGNQAWGMFVIGGDGGGGYGFSINGRGNDYGELGDWSGAGGGGNTYVNVGDELSARNLISVGSTQALTSCSVTSNVMTCTTTAANTFTNLTWVTTSGQVDSTFNTTCRVTSATNANPFTCVFLGGHTNASTTGGVVGTASTTQVWNIISATYKDGGSNPITVGCDFGAGPASIQMLGGFGEPQIPCLGGGTISQGLVNTGSVSANQKWTSIFPGTTGYTIIPPTTTGRSNINFVAVADQPFNLNLQSGLTTDQNVQIQWSGHNGTAGVAGPALWNLGTVSGAFELVGFGHPLAFFPNGLADVGADGATSVLNLQPFSSGLINGFGGSQTFGSGTIQGPAACETSFGITTLSTGGTTTTTGQNCLPALAIIDAVVYRITTTITTATSFTIGDTTTAARFCATQSTLTAGTTGVCFAQADQTGAPGPRQTAAAKVQVTTSVAPGAGAIRLIVYYHTWAPPTS